MTATVDRKKGQKSQNTGPGEPGEGKALRPPDVQKEKTLANSIRDGYPRDSAGSHDNRLGVAHSLQPRCGYIGSAKSWRSPDAGGGSVKYWLDRGVDTQRVHQQVLSDPARGDQTDAARRTLLPGLAELAGLGEGIGIVAAVMLKRYISHINHGDDSSRMCTGLHGAVRCRQRNIREPLKRDRNAEQTEEQRPKRFHDRSLAERHAWRQENNLVKQAAFSDSRMTMPSQAVQIAVFIRDG